MLTTAELHLYYRVRRMYTDVLRAKKKEVPDDSEASSSENDSDDEDQLDKIARWDKRRDRRHHTAKRVKRLISQGNLPAECGDVDNIQAWMDDQGHILNVSPPNRLLVVCLGSNPKRILMYDRNSSGWKIFKNRRDGLNSRRAGMNKSRKETHQRSVNVRVLQCVMHKSHRVYDVSFNKLTICHNRHTHIFNFPDS